MILVLGTISGPGDNWSVEAVVREMGASKEECGMLRPRRRGCSSAPS
jgi:hypothetical protein